MDYMTLKETSEIWGITPRRLTIIVLQAVFLEPLRWERFG